MNKEYNQYMTSDTWHERRQQVLERDNRQCQTCLHKGENYRLEVHHKTYKRFRNERLEDLITLCASCHEAITNIIRGRRYARVNPDDMVQHIKRKEDRFLGVSCEHDYIAPKIIKSKGRYLPPSRKDKNDAED